MKRFIAAAIAFTGAWLGFGMGVAHADSGRPWVCAGVELINFGACLADPLPDRLPFF